MECDEIFDAAESSFLGAAINGDLDGLHSAYLVRAEAMVADGAAVYLLDGEFIMLLSPISFPNAMAEQAKAMRVMSARLGQAARPILPLCAEGILRGRSFLVVPRCKALSTSRIGGRIDRWRVRGKALQWLREVASLGDSPNRDAAMEFSRSLASLSATTGLPSSIVALSDKYRQHLTAGQIAVGHVPMHGDFWQGNIMNKSDGSLAIIDWGGSTPYGYGLYDLMRIGSSLRVPSSQMKDEIAWHARALRLSVEDALIHLLAGLGHYAGRLGEFPRARFIEMAVDCFDRFERLV